MSPLLLAATFSFLAATPPPEPTTAEADAAEVETEKERIVYAPLVADRALRKLAERLDGSLVVRFREIAPFELLVPTEEEAPDPAIARLLRFGCRDISCVSALATTYQVEKVIMGTYGNQKIEV